jgi:hypothetical protein
MLKKLNEVLHKVGFDMHVQNLNHRLGDGLRRRWGKATGDLWRQGRLWVRDHGKDHEARLRIEWTAGLSMPGFSLTLDNCDHEVTVRFEGLPGTLWISVPLGYSDETKRLIEGIQKLADVRRYSDVNIVSATFHHNQFWWNLMQDPDEWCATDPWWRRGTIDFDNLLLGDAKIEDELLGDNHDVEIPMPEGTYRWTIQMKRRTIKRRFSSHTLLMYDAKSLKGQHIPFPGKGENSWDCGPDGVHSVHGPAEHGDNVQKVIGKLVGNALHNRRRRGAKADYTDGGAYDQKKAS